MQAFGSILGTLGNIGTGLGTGLSALSPITSLFGMINQFNQAQKEKAIVDRSIYYSKHPEAISNMVTAATKPLDTGLTKGVENIVNASLASQGLSQAPGIQSQVLAQALAPYQQQNQRLALNEVLAAIGLPEQALASLQSSMRPDQLSLMLKGILPGGGTGTWGGGMVGGTPDNALSGISYIPQPDAGVYGPDLAPPFDPNQPSSASLPNLFPGGS
jgi:hypothetical protein